MILASVRYQDVIPRYRYPRLQTTSLKREVNVKLFLLIITTDSYLNTFVSNCNKKKPTGNIGYILTEFEEKNTIEVPQSTQQMLLYCKVLF